MSGQYVYGTPGGGYAYGVHTAAARPEQAAQRLEFRTTRDGHAYSWKEFVDFFGPYSAKAWRRARVATQKEKDEALLRRVRLLLEK